MAVPPSSRVGDLLISTRRDPINEILRKPSQALLLQNWLGGNSVTRQTTGTSGSASLSFARVVAPGGCGNGEKHGEEMELFLRRVQEDPTAFEHLIDKLRSTILARSLQSSLVTVARASPQMINVKVKKCQTRAVSL
ncbi:unnamed protein product [Symbiodinium sp. CCMP2592]|nr:unnamed protein product [Symbiodinium sp. CCMP2592]